MQRVYSRITWENEPSVNTPLNETNLNKMDYALSIIDGRVVDMGMYWEDARDSAELAAQKATEASTDATRAETARQGAETAEDNAEDWSTLSKSWAIGTTNTRTGEDTNNSKYYAEQSGTYLGIIQSEVDAAVAGFGLQGTYDNTRTYNFMDVVYEPISGNSYVAKQETTGNFPSEDDGYWHILARGIIVDSELSTSSVNPVENMAITTELNTKLAVDGDGMDTTVGTFITNTDEFPTPEAGDNQATLWGKVAKWFTDGVDKFLRRDPPTVENTNDGITSIQPLTTGLNIFTSSTINNPASGYAGLLVSIRTDTSYGAQFALCSKGLFYRKYTSAAFGSWLDMSYETTQTTYATNFGNYEGNTSYAPTLYRYGKTVHIAGVATVTLNEGVTSGTLFTVPSGYRPSKLQYQRCQGSYQNTWLLTIAQNGTATIRSYGTTTATTIPKGAWLPFNITYVM